MSATAYSNSGFEEVSPSSTVSSLCEDTQCKDNLDIRTTQLGTHCCILTAVIPLSSLTKDILMQGQVSWLRDKQLIQREREVTVLKCKGKTARGDGW